MRLVWLPETKSDVRRLHDFLFAKSHEAAERAIRAIQAGADQLALHPKVGRPLNDDAGHRELFVPFGVGAYVLRYRIVVELVIIVRVWHSRELR